MFFYHYRHLKNTGDMFEFAIVSEEAISKGIRRIVAVSGHDAEKVSNYLFSFVYIWTTMMEFYIIRFLKLLLEINSQEKYSHLHC